MRLWHDYLSLLENLPRSLACWEKQLSRQLEAAFSPQRHGDLVHWCRLLAQLPRITAPATDFSGPVVRIGSATDCDAGTRRLLEGLLRQFHPWRKGPFEVFGIFIDAEWRSDFKWARLEQAIAPLAGRLVLDVGAGNGYYLWRMLGQGAERVIGIDPTLRYVCQFLALKRLAGDWPADLLPLALEDLPPKLAAFDTVFSMGVLYHRRSPFDHLFALKDCLRQGGELVLETLVIEGGDGKILVPEDRYARMRNVWFIPSVATLEGWLKRAGFRHVRCIDVSRTTTDEQRATSWMQFQSLADFLDPEDPGRTVEGHPAPRRAILLAEKP